MESGPLRKLMFSQFFKKEPWVVQDEVFGVFLKEVSLIFVWNQSEWKLLYIINFLEKLHVFQKILFTSYSSKSSQSIKLQEYLIRIKGYIILIFVHANSHEGSKLVVQF